ncbi:TrkH family potassium uptake protein [Roseicyclus persicicus]|uniref:TrkH family potassium uptake protein n=1 Tax=Roseicyclus persicicus TaxID=2650661 RepID=A0A7X6JY45_9RHOB|nr:TrkH family potassium uptake protein [Roseibacterium persicicum]NKX46257.1 TrkH family potassium uptake protein [Roseibacterium persicicum]
MARYFRSLPFFVVLLFTAAGATLVPAVYGASTRDFDTARVFFYSGILIAVAAMLMGFAAQGAGRETTGPRSLLALLLSYLWLPGVLAVPMAEAIGDTRWINVYFDMVSALTTTGAAVFEPARLADTVHLWRATVGWFGGMLIWVTALAVLAPLNLGGFEVTSEASVSGQLLQTSGQSRSAAPSERLRKQAALLVPVYVTLTAVLAVALALAGERPLHAVIHAMSTLATSGISATGGLKDSGADILGEMLIFLFLVFALTRRSFTGGFDAGWAARIARDREVRIAIFAVVVLPSLLFLRHWIGALEVDDLANVGAAVRALWGSIFTVLSFLTTTGFVSESWAEARSWSGLPTPGLILIGLVMMGGGVATTAGGLKLLRVYALYKHGAREIDRLVHPHSVASAGQLGRRIRREGAYIAWVVFMLFLLSLAAVMVALAATGLDFEQSMVLAVAALSTTGTLAQVAGEAPIPYLTLTDPAKIVLIAAMIVGRMETLVFLAIFSPAFWRS